MLAVVGMEARRALVTKGGLARKVSLFTEVFKGFVMIRLVSFLSKLLPEGCKESDVVGIFLVNVVAHDVEPP